MTNELESILFNNETTYRTDFSDGEIKLSLGSSRITRLKHKKRKPHTLKDVHTMSDWIQGAIPFDLFGKTKEVVRTDPRQVQQIFTPPPDLQKEHIRRTRPRLVMTPAVSIDDAPQESRKLVLEDVYLTTTVSKMGGDSSVATCIRTIPAPELPAPANPVYVPRWRPQYVSPEWRKDSAAWDGRQLRTDCDPRKEFYLAIPLTCSVCQPAPPSQDHK